MPGTGRITLNGSERDDEADGGVARAVSRAGRRGTATSGVDSSAREYVAVAPRWGKIDRLPTPWRGSGGSGVAREEARTCAKDTLNR